MATGGSAQSNYQKEKKSQANKRGTPTNKKEKIVETPFDSDSDFC